MEDFKNGMETNVHHTSILILYHRFRALNVQKDKLE